MEDSILLKIKTLDGREHMVDVCRSLTILDLKTKIESSIGVAQNAQRIIFQGRILTDDLTVATAGLENNSVVHLVERPPPMNSGQSSANTETQENPVQEGRRSSNSRNRIRSQLERHTQQFMNAIAELNSDNSLANPSNTSNSNDTDMESFARQLSSIATGIEILPEYLRTLADQVRSDPATPQTTLQNNLNQLSSITQRLGALSNTLANIQVPLRSQPPRRLEQNRRIPTSLRDMAGSGQGQGVVIPVVHNANGTFETGPVTSIGGSIQNIMNNLGPQIQSQIQSNIAGLLGTEATQTPETENNQPEDDGNQSRNPREPSLTARVMTMISRPTDIDGNPIDSGIDRVEGINANITINANVSPNVTIRIIPESLANAQASLPLVSPANTSRNAENTPASPEFVTADPEEVSRRIPALAPEIVSQIRDSVANLNDGRPVIIECENQNTNSEIGRVIGEAVTQTFQSLSDQITDQGQENATSDSNEANITTDSHSETNVRTETISTSTTLENEQQVSQQVSASRSENGVPIEEHSFSFTKDQLQSSILEYFGVPQPNPPNPIISMVRGFFTDIRLGDVVQIFDSENAPRSIAELCRKMITFAGMIESGMKTIFRIFFDEQQSADNADLVLSNVSLIKEFMSKLPSSIENGIDLGRLVKNIGLKWLKLNSKILQGGLESLLSILKNTIITNEHPRSTMPTVLRHNLRKNCSGVNVELYIVKKENECIEPEEDPIEDPIEEEVEVQKPNKESEKTKRESSMSKPVSSSHNQPSSNQDQPNRPRVIELDETDVPLDWRPVLANDKNKIQRMGSMQLSKAYIAGVPKKV